MGHRVRSPSNRSFSLIEVIITAGILGGAVVFVLRAFATSLYAAKRSQGITIASFLAEEKLWKAQCQYRKDKTLPSFPDDTVQGRVFSWALAPAVAEPVTGDDLRQAVLTVKWKDTERGPQAQIDCTFYVGAQ